MADKPRVRVAAHHVAQSAIAANFVDGFENVVANIATEKDKTFGIEFSTILFNPRAIEAMYRSTWLGRKIVDIPVEDMTRAWRRFDVDDAIRTKIEAAEKKFDLKETVREALRVARLFGSGAIIIGAKQGQEDPSKPLDIDAMKPGDLKYLHVAFAPFLSIYQWEDDVDQEGFGKPKLYHYSPFYHRLGGGMIQLHASRVIPFSGVKLPPYASLAGNAWGDSIFQSIYQVVTTASGITAVIASLINETKVDVFKVQNLASYLANATGEQKIIKRFQLANMFKSINNALVLDAQEDYDQKQINFGGISDVHLRIMQECAGAADIPVTRLLGQSPAGMSATGESDLRNYYDGIGAKQENDLRPRLDVLDRVIFASEGIEIPEGEVYKYNSLWQETPTVKADVALKKAQATQVYANAGLIDTEVLGKAVLSQLQADQTYPGLDDAVKESKTEGLPDPDQIAEQQAAAAAAAGGKDQEDGTPPGAKKPDAKPVKDAAPRTLYVCRPVLNAAEIIAWAKRQGFKSTLAADDLHVTVAFSRQPVDWMAIDGNAADEVKVQAGGPRLVETLGQGAVALLFKSWELAWRWRDIKDIGASWDWPTYQPHITITYEPGDVDLSKVEPYQGEIVLGPERFEEIEDSP
jgi:phage-related protein (TIGR01555 family)